ncbi:hypothetical protein YC2023_041717 [Brassica napus]
MTKRRSLRSKISDMHDLLLSDKSLITDNLSIGLKKPSAHVADDEPTASSLVGGGTKSKENSILSFVMYLRRSMRERKIRKTEDFLYISMESFRSFWQ